MFDMLNIVLSFIYLFLLLAVSVFGIHRLMLVCLFHKHRNNPPHYQNCFSELPNVTIQLPIYNEPYVAKRIITSCCNIDYPKDKLQIQVLDDSTDNTTDIAMSVVKDFVSKGYNIICVHRDNRSGFKAGALENGLETASGEFIAIFDADFVPQPDFLKKTIHYFTDNNVGMVQVRWEHINRNHSLLTHLQSVFLDGHFVIEHTARNRSKRFMNFNGTSGIWRRSCIEQCGGWQHDTLTEDMDLSYRCQLQGWQFVYLLDVTAPGELPPEIHGFKSQQFRWTKGAIQTGKKLLPSLLSSSLPLKIKLEAIFHMLNPVNYLFMSILILLLPIVRLNFLPIENNLYFPPILDFALLIIGTCSTSVFYMYSQKKTSCSWLKGISYIPFLMALGVGMGINNSKGVLEAILGRTSDFKRTPKYGVEAGKDTKSWTQKTGRLVDRNCFMTVIELAYAAYLSFCIYICLLQGFKMAFLLPFLIIFAFGFYYVAALTIYTSFCSTRQRCDAIA
ncbi:MAG: glycosyltransferase [Phycisphaerae bacterium]|nr:glycosyltransferase [Phycisphaerae bacterium]